MNEVNEEAIKQLKTGSFAIAQDDNAIAQDDNAIAQDDNAIAQDDNAIQDDNSGRFCKAGFFSGLDGSLITFSGLAARLGSTRLVAPYFFRMFSI